MISEIIPTDMDDLFCLHHVFMKCFSRLTAFLLKMTCFLKFGVGK